MNHTRHQIAPGIHLDARRAVWLERTHTLAIADLHLGYAWAHRVSGNLLPVHVPDDTAARIHALLDEYQPQTLALLGDLVHAAVPQAVQELLALIESVAPRVKVELIAGNHDRHLAKALRLPLAREHRSGPHLLIHGDGHDAAMASTTLAAMRASEGLVIIGHEHPAVVLGDSVAHRARVPCFLHAPGLLVLPAFTHWSNGTVGGEGLSAYRQSCEAFHTIAILAGKLLPLPRRGGY